MSSRGTGHLVVLPRVCRNTRFPRRLGMTRDGYRALEPVAEELGLCDAAAMKQYSADLRERLLGAIDAGLPQAEAARLFGVGVSTIKRWRRRRQETGSVVATRRPGRPRRVRPEVE